MHLDKNSRIPWADDTTDTKTHKLVTDKN